MFRIRNLRRTLASSSGFTLLEVLLAVSIVSVAVTVVGGGIFQVRSVQQFWVDDAVATRDLRHASSLFARDALNAEDAFDAGGVDRLACQPIPSASEVILSWTDTQEVAHTARYHVSQQTLLRVSDGFQQTLTARVVEGSVSFSLCGSLLTLAMEVEADRGTTETVTLRTYLRKLQ